MRPILVLLTAKATGGVNETAIHSAVTLELLHTASLVHDDIVDESDERRGQASVNAVYDNKVAVLVGDYLLSSSLEQAALTGDAHIVARIAQLGKSLSEGEILQLSNIHTETVSEEAYFTIIRQKTAALFATCAELGAIATGATPEVAATARELGEVIGICFQIRDDIFDYYEQAAIGKPTGNDMAEGSNDRAFAARASAPRAPSLSKARVYSGTNTADITAPNETSNRKEDSESAASYAAFSAPVPHKPARNILLARPSSLVRHITDKSAAADKLFFPFFPVPPIIPISLIQLFYHIIMQK